MKYKTEQIKAALLKGGLVLTAERAVGKTTALLQAAAEMGSKNVAILSKDMQLRFMRRAFHEAFPYEEIPAMSSSIDSLRGRSALLIDELALWSDNDQEDILYKAKFFRHWAATGTLYYPHTPVTLIGS